METYIDPYMDFYMHLIYGIPYGFLYESHVTPLWILYGSYVDPYMGSLYEYDAVRDMHQIYSYGNPLWVLMLIVYKS